MFSFCLRLVVYAAVFLTASAPFIWPNSEDANIEVPVGSY